MQSKSAFVLLFLAFSWFGLRLSPVQQPPQCVAVITEINGEALLRRANKNEFIKACWGTQLSPGDQNKTSIRNTFRNEPECSSLHSVLGAFYINQGLLQDAISEFQIISKINNEAPLPREILGSLYSDSADKDNAIEELQKVLALSKNKDK